MPNSYYADLAFQALESKFGNRQDFDDFVSSIDPPARQGKFVFAASTYLFIVKRGDWQVAVEDVDLVITYFTQSYKLVGIFAVIESLSEMEYRDFFQWLSARVDYPIQDEEQLKRYYDQYNDDHGSIRRCRKFFEKLPASQQQQLCRAILVDGKPMPSIKKVAEFLYNLRSKFVHQAKFVLEVGSPFPVFSNLETKKARSVNITASSIQDMFEEGLIAWFRP